MNDIVKTAASYEVFPSIDSVMDVWSQGHQGLLDAARQTASSPGGICEPGKYPGMPEPIDPESSSDEIAESLATAVAWVAFSQDPVYQVSRIICKKAADLGVEKYLNVGLMPLALSSPKIFSLPGLFSVWCSVLDRVFLICTPDQST